MQCNRCGAELPDSAHFCLQCGTSVTTPQTQTGSGQPPPKLNFTQPALAGGLALGLLSGIPLIAYGNCVCCMWVIGGGALSAYMLMQQRPTGITYGDAAFGGMLSGFIGAFVSTLISIPIRLITFRLMQSQQDARQALDQIFKDAPPALHELANRLFSNEISAVTILATLIPNMLVYSLFAMLGGILFVAIREKRKAVR